MTNTAEFQNTMEQLFQNNALEDGLILKAKARAWDQFLEIGMPTSRTEVYQYVHLRSLLAHTYVSPPPTSISKEQIAAFIYPECTQSCLVFVNGQYHSTLSSVKDLPKKMVVTTLPESTKTYSAFLNNQWAKSVQEETDPFVLLNAALHQNGLFIYIPPKTVVEAPIQILNLIECKNAAFITPRMHLFAGQQAQASFLTTCANISSPHYCLNQSAELVLDEGAQITLTQLSLDHALEAWHFDALRATLKRNSSLKTVSFTNGSATVRHDYRIALTGENAEASLNGAWMLNAKSEAHTNVLMDHQAPHCRSMQLYKGAINDFSRSSFEGKILVRQAAQKTEAFQLNNNLLLGERCQADSKPNLEIFADDVKASHGATIGQIDDEQLFYMKTRGFPAEMAKNLLIASYFQEVVDKIPIKRLQHELIDRYVKKA